jgi:hypothetical protein
VEILLCPIRHSDTNNNKKDKEIMNSKRKFGDIPIDISTLENFIKKKV